MLNLLRSNQPIAILVLPVLTMIFAVATVFGGASPYEWNTLLSPLLSVLPGLSNLWMHYSLIFINALLLNRLFNRHELCDHPSVLAGALYVLIACALPPSLPLSPVFAGGPFFILGINEVLKVYRQNEVAHFYFNGGFFIGIAALFSPLFIIPGAFLLISVFYTRAVQWREVFLPIAALLLPALMFVTVLWLIGTPGQHFGAEAPDIGVYGNGVTSDAPGMGEFWWIYAGVCFLLGVLGLLRMFGSFGSSSNKSKNSKAVLFFFVLATATMAGVAALNDVLYGAQFTLFGIAWMLAYVFGDEARKWKRVLFYAFLLLIAGAVVTQLI